MNKLLTFLFTIGAVFIFVLGGGAGILYQTQKDAPQIDKLASLLKRITSRAIPSITAYGQVASIEGKNITLASGGDNIIVSVRGDTEIYSFAQPTAQKQEQAVLPTKQLVKFEDIKKGDTLNISLKVLPDGQLEGNTIIIMPLPNVALPANNAK